MLRKKITVDQACQLVTEKTGMYISGMADVGNKWIFTIACKDGRIIPTGSTFPAVTKDGDFMEIDIQDRRKEQKGKSINVPSKYRIQGRPYIEFMGEKTYV